MIPSSERISEQIKQCNIYIAPDMQGYSTASFGNYREILDIGYNTGEKYQLALRHLADSIGKSTKPFEKISLGADSVMVKGTNLVNENLVLSKMGIEPGEKVSQTEIEAGIQRIYGIINFNLNYS